mmetsp:Transcript_12983/g.18154  ORF Transcript_12983/g.18154 Transcript_12983/m.18154 type:complete len:104 (+) Transcript_12983:155-466(+)|eukprot:jgi/Bigna1/86703/estExt_fgenesh1_pg.C_130005
MKRLSLLLALPLAAQPYGISRVARPCAFKAVIAPAFRRKRISTNAQAPKDPVWSPTTAPGEIEGLYNLLKSKKMIRTYDEVEIPITEAWGNDRAVVAFLRHYG